MVSTLLSEVHFWTLQEDVAIKHQDYGSFKYYQKKEPPDNLYAQAKKQYCERRNVIWAPLNKRPAKLRDKLKELEDYLIHNKIVSFTWEENKLRLLLSTGLVVNLTVNAKTGDIVNIIFDKQLSAKLQVNIICDGTIFGSQVICICNDGHVVGFGGPWKDGWVLEGGPRRNLHYSKDWLAVWGKAGAEHPQPWSPLAKDHQRANLHLYWCGPRDPELLAYKKTDGEPLQVVISKISHKTLTLIEQKVTQRGSVSVEVSNFELTGNNQLKRVSVTSVPLQTQVSCSALSHFEDRLVIGCIDGTVALLDRRVGSTKTVKAAFIPTFAVWHNAGAIVAISNERGQLQYFDTALNCIKSELLNEESTPTSIFDLSGYFNVQFSVTSVNWDSKDLIFAFEQGPILLLTHLDSKSLTFKGLCQNYLKTGQVESCIKLLLSWEFDEDSFYVLQRVTAHLLRQPMTEEIARQLQAALGCFHSSPVPLSTIVRHRYGGQVYSLTRRFFHQLVRAGMFEMAFLLAVDLGHHDLFMDLHYIAVKIGETEMAAAARAQASALLSRCSSEASNCSRSSCSQCCDDSASDSSLSDDSNISNDVKRKVFDFDAPLSITGDNFLTTNFNQADPTTITTNANPKSDLPPTTSSISQYSDYKFNFTPKATFVKSPQVPASFKLSTSAPTSTLSPPPLPFTPPLPNLGIPCLQNNNFPPPHIANPQFNSPNLFANKFNSSKNFNKQIVPPPLPSIPPLIPGNSNNKKAQAKVKFSDTVTAFIVPEIKRPIRPAPPPHVTDPQKELADSLPLCHPNEDYLKDFTPVRKAPSESSSGENSSGSGEKANAPPKIKVVHFGVV